MRSRLALFNVALFVVLFGTAALRAVVPSRIQGSIADATAVVLPGHIAPQVKSAVDHGRLAGATQLSSMSLNFALSATQQAALDVLLAAQQNPASPSYHRWLTPAQFGEQFGLSADDLAKVTAWLQSRGFTVDRVAPSRNALHFSGTVDQVEQSFHTELHALTLNGESHFANATEPSVPSALAGVVAGIRGLNNFRLKAHAHASAKVVPYSVGGRSASMTPAATDGATPPNEYVAPEDFAKIYDVTALYNAGFNGSASYPIAVIGQSAVYSADITAFRSAFGLSSTLPTMVLEPGTGTSVTDTDDLSESELDLEWSGAVAPSASVYFIYTGSTSANGVFDALQYAIQTYTVSGKPIPIISLSYGSCEADDTAADYATYESWFKQANAQGQTILNSSGDEGAAGCDYTTVAANSYAATQGLAVSYPASSAYVTGVGGTSFSGDITNTSTYWATTNDTDAGNELGLYIPSSTWNDTPNTAGAIANTGLSASGGGVSSLWTKPSWQTGVAGIPADGKRDVPDVALSADPNHDGFLVCIDGSCAGSNGYFNVYGGTSVAAPSLAGLLALTEQKLGAAQGNLNPALYHVASDAATYAQAFHDITTGSNIVPCVVSSADTGCVNGSMGYSANAGYDLVTGLGSVDALNLGTALAALTANVPTGNTVVPSVTAPTTLQPVTFTATIAQASGSAAPTGTVTFLLDTATSGPVVTLSSSGTASTTMTITAGGSHTVSSVYSGDPNYYGSIGSTTLTVTVPPSPSTTTTLTATPSSVALGGSLTLTASIASSVTGTFPGNVTFTTTLGTLGSAPVTTSTSGVGTATLTVNAAVATLPIGTGDVITASYSGGTSTTSSYLGSSGTTTVTVTNPTITLAATNITVASGGTGTSTITVTSGGNYAGTVALTASTTSTLNGSYAFNPASVSVTQSAPGKSTFTLSGATASAKPSSGTFTLKSGLASLAAGGGLAFAGLLFFGATGRKRTRFASLLTALVFTALAAGLGCSSSSTVISTPTTGTFTVTITGTDTTTNSITGSTTMTVTVQ